MDSDVSPPTQENNEPKAEFRKITNDAANRKYRRRSPNSGSSNGDGSPTHDYSSRDISKASNHVRRSNDKVDDRSSSRSQHGRSSDSYRHSSRGNRHDEYSRYERHADEDDRSHDVSSRSGRESRGGSNADGRDRERDYNRSRDRCKDLDRYPRDKSERTRYEERRGGRYDDRDRHSRDKYHHRDEKREYRSSRDHRGDRSVSYENPTGCQNASNSRKETGDMKDVDGSKDGREKSETELDRHEKKHGRVGESSEDRSACVSEDSAAKWTKFSLGSNFRKGSEQDEDPTAKVSPAHVPVSDADIATSVDAAKVAAMKAAQLVNQNLTSTGFMTADQKKKLLWGNKKINAAEESSHRWDTSLFPDRERQEKFQKLMSLRLPWYIWPIVGCEGRSEGGLKTFKQSRCREAESTSARFREAVHCWAPTKRRSYCRVRSINFHLGCSFKAETLFRCLIYYCMRYLETVVMYPFRIAKNSNVLFRSRVLLPSTDWLPGLFLNFSFGIWWPIISNLIYMIY